MDPSPPPRFCGVFKTPDTLLNASFAVVFTILWKQCFVYLGLHDRNLDGLRRLLKRTAAACGMMTALLACYSKQGILEAQWPRHSQASSRSRCSMRPAAPMLARRPLSWQIREPRRVIIVGSGRRAGKPGENFVCITGNTRQLLGFMDDRALDSLPPDIANRLIGNVEDLPAYLLRNTVDELILAAPMRSCYD